MSHHFISAECWPTERDERDIHEVKHTFEVITEENVRKNPNCAQLIPETTGNYNKAIFECAVNLTEELGHHLRFNKKGYNSNKTEHEIDERLQIVAVEMANTLQWIVNSTSWRTGEFHDFDKHEINSRLRRLENATKI